MELSRRDFLTRGGLAAAASLMPGQLLAAIDRGTAPMPDVASWAAVRALFPLSRDVFHFSSFFIASHPKPVREAIDGFRRALDANPFVTVEHGLFASEAENLELKVLADIAPYLGGTPDQISLTHNTTTGLALVYNGYPLRAGDEVLTTTHDHFVHHESIRYAVERAGATMRKLRLYERGAEVSAGAVVGRLRAAIGPKTRVLGVTWVHSSTGVRLPIREIAQVVAAANRGRSDRDRIRLVVDGVHGLGSTDETVAEMGCDFFCAGTHKWMFAPRGTGIVWARQENWARLRPTIPSFSSFAAYQDWLEGRSGKSPVTAATMSPGGFQAFEHVWAMGAAFRLHQRIGRRRVAERIRELNDQCKAGLASIPGVTLHTPRDPALSAGVVAFEVAGFTPQQVVARLLEKRIIASTSPYKVAYARLAPSLVNDPAQVDAALRAVRSLGSA